MARSNHHGRPLAVLLFDIDGFKLINDELGHLGGDFLLRELVARLKSKVCREDLFARYGGEEFALVLAETTFEQAIQAAERIRQLVEAVPFVYEGLPCRVTISLGVSATTGQELNTAADLLRQADEKLYQAKRTGRNRVVA